MFVYMPIQKNGIEYVVNVSATCPQSPFVAESNFLRIPVNDGHQDRLLPFFADVFRFLGKSYNNNNSNILP